MSSTSLGSAFILWLDQQVSDASWWPLAELALELRRSGPGLSALQQRMQEAGSESWPLLPAQRSLALDSGLLLPLGGSASEVAGRTLALQTRGRASRTALAL